MTRAVGSLLRCLVPSDRLEEMLGDLAELEATTGRWRVWRDVASICVRAPRLHAGGAVTGLAVVTLCLLAALHPPSHPHRITATDPAGTFTLELAGSRVLAASVDGVPVAPDRLIQTDGRLVIRGGAPGGDLNIRVRRDGSVYWRGRPALSPPAR